MDSSINTDNEQTRFHNQPVDTGHYIKRNTTRKNLQLRDQVVYDIDKKESSEGQIVSFHPYGVDILKVGTTRLETRDRHDLYKKDELLKSGGHWDYITDSARTELLKAAQLPNAYYTKDWSGFHRDLKTVLKDMAPTSQPNGVAIRNLGSKKEDTKPGNDTINESDPSPVEHEINTTPKKKDE